MLGNQYSKVYFIKNFPPPVSALEYNNKSALPSLSIVNANNEEEGYHIINQAKN